MITVFDGLLRLTATASTGLYAGMYLNGAIVLVPSQRHLSPATYIESEQAATALGTNRYRIVVAVCLVTGLLVIPTLPKGPATLLDLAAVAMVLAATALTVTRVVPLNERVRSWSAVSPPTDWASARNSWHRYHYARTVLAVLAMLLQLSAVLMLG